MAPACIIGRDQHERTTELGNEMYIFCSLPYHQLAPYTSLTATAESRLHPVVTLLQYKHPSTIKKRDLEQTVCFLEDTPPDHCFHIPNLWCLIINNST